MRRLLLAGLLAVALIIPAAPASAQGPPEALETWLMYKVGSGSATKASVTLTAAHFLDSSVGTNWRTKPNDCDPANFEGVDEGDIPDYWDDPGPVTVESLKADYCDVNALTSNIIPNGGLSRSWVCNPSCKWIYTAPDPTEPLNAQQVFSWYYNLRTASNAHNEEPGSGASSWQILGEDAPWPGAQRDLPGPLFFAERSFLDAYGKIGSRPQWDIGLGIATTLMAVEPSEFEGCSPNMLNGECTGGYLWNYGVSGEDEFRPRLEDITAASAERHFVWSGYSSNQPVGMMLGLDGPPTNRATFETAMAAAEPGITFVGLLAARTWCHAMSHGSSDSWPANAPDSDLNVYMPPGCEDFWTGYEYFGHETLPRSKWLDGASFNVSTGPFTDTFEPAGWWHRPLLPGHVPPPAYKAGIPNYDVKVFNDLAPPIDY